MNRRALAIAAFSIAASVLLVKSFPADAPDAPGATYSQGVLHLSIAHHTAAAGTLAVELLDPDDAVLARSQQHVDGAATPWHAELKPAKAVAIDDLVWQRVRYRFTPAGGNESAVDDTESVSRILHTPVLRIIGQQSYLSGGSAAVRVIVTDSNGQPVGGTSTLHIWLDGASLFEGRLNARGTTEAQFHLPAGVVGEHPLRYAVDTPIGSTEFTQKVRIEDKAGILLTTEKPLYQPGQTIHVRALALDRANRHAAASRPLTFEIEDSRGNKVFRKNATTDAFGIASAEFTLADEVNLGTYHLRAEMESNRAEVALNVERYVLPKFKVAIEFTGNAKHGYRPGDHVTGTVRANYFFGKPVENAEIVLKSFTQDVTSVEHPAIHGKTGADGAYAFDLVLPNYFAGSPLNHGAARAVIEASVKDSAGHTETRGEPVTVSQSPLIVTAIPESGALIPNLENQVFLLTSYADGQPAVTHLKVRRQTLDTDSGGVALLRIAAGPYPEKLEIEASDRDGVRTTVSVRLTMRGGDEQILLRTDRAVYRAGDRISMKVFSAKKSGSAYVDIVKDGQTVLTRDLEFVNGQAELTLTATPELAGTLDCNAYLFGRDARAVGDHRLIFVQPADELKIEATADSAVYKPGDDARIRFRVTNGRGEGVSAALGVQVVDEAVFALAEKQPGFAKVFFYLEQEAMKPRYEIHSIGMPDVVEPWTEQRNLAARALFAGIEMVNTNRFERELGRDVPMNKFAAYALRYRRQFIERAKLQVAGGPAQRDPWGGELKVESQHSGSAGTTYLVRSSGPDKRFDTPDDLTAYLAVRGRKIAGAPADGPSIGVNVEHDRGPFNGRAEISGSVLDLLGAVGEGAAVTLRDTATGESRAAKADGAGQFRFSALPEGSYELKIASGRESASRKITLVARDRAVVYARMIAPAADVSVVEFTPAPARMAGLHGGILGMAAFNGPMAMIPEPAARVKTMAVDGIAASMALKPVTGNPAGGQPAAPRVRSYFPEALYINPEIITDSKGVATISIPLADSITTWRMALTASTAYGALGSAASSIKVFQDFFVDLDLPVTLTQGDRVSIPIAAYNYSGSRGDIDLHLQAADWYTLVSDTADKAISVEPNRVGGAQFTVEAKRIGKFKLTLSARMSGAAKRADIVVREIEVVPNGREQSQVFNGRLETAAAHALSFPAAAIPDASKVLVRLYPGPLSQVVEGMDAILKMPYGCFEQTSSATYPNVLALDYMKRIKKLTPEVHAKAEGFIANGYQRLLTYEVPGGGFSWFGNAPANKILTAYGLMEFSDMAKVHEVDPNLIRRTQEWLAASQQPDGSWLPDRQFINEGATNRFNTDTVRIAAYLGWALQSTGYQGAAVDKARQFVDTRMSGKADPYTLAVVANFAADYKKDREFTNRAIQMLLDARTEKDGKVWWDAPETGVYSTGESAAVETTGLAVQALLKTGQSSAIAAKALGYIASKKDATGAWRTTQATITALRALLLSTEKGTADVQGTVEISLDGRPAEKVVLTPANNDLLHQFVFNGTIADVSLKFEGKGSLAYQIVGRYFVPWTAKPGAAEPLSIEVTYDRTSLAHDDIATATATIRNNLTKSANMVMVDLGIPPGFDLLSEDLQAYQEKKSHLQKFNLTATQAILYLDGLAPGETQTYKFRLRAKYPIKAKTFQSRVYEYYDPAVSAVAAPVQLEVR